VRRSRATSVNDAINAKVNWLCEMFGSDSEGRPYLADLLRRTNPTARHGERVILRLDEKLLCPCRLQVEVGSNQLNEPQALDNLAEKIERTYRLPNHIPTSGSPSGRSAVQITLEGDFLEFLKKGGKEKFLKFLAKEGVTKVRVIRVESGSIKLTLSLPEDQAERLFWLADSGALDQFGLLGFDYVPLEHEVPATIPGLVLERYLSYLVHRAQILLRGLPGPVRLRAEELAFETLRSAFGTTETALSHYVTGAEQLPWLEKIQDRLLVDSLGTLNLPPGEVHRAQQLSDSYIALTKVPTSGESSEGEALLGEGTGANSGTDQQPAQQTTDPPTADYVPVGDEAPPDLPGYEILTPPIGEPDRWPKMGGMGVVWRVRDLQFHRLLAVKVMKAESADSRWVRYFLREARITAQLAHPSIVPVHAMGRLADGRPYYTMKLVEGKTLAEILQAEPDVASRRTELLQVFARICEALAFAHRKGVIHLDLKPSNVMVGAHGEVQVMDWGLVKLLDESDDRLGVDRDRVIHRDQVIHRDTNPGNVVFGAYGEVQVMDWGLVKLLDESDDRLGVVGTWPYMSREQANGRIEEIDRRSDVFGLGGMLCAILTGKPPYVGSTPEDVIRQAREADLTGAHAELEGCGADAELIALARACLSAEPNDRPEDALVVEKRLKDYLASVEERLLQAERDRAAAEARAKEARRRMLWVAASAGLFLLLLLLAAFFAWRDREARQQHLADTIDKALTAAMGGDLEGAEQATAEAELAGASTGQVRMLRGGIALQRGRSQEAIRDLEQAVQLLPNSVAAWGMLAAAYASNGHWDRYERTIREMALLTPSTPEDFLFKGYAEANLDPVRGLQTIKQAFDRRPMMGIALLLRAEVRALVAQDTDNLEEAEGAVQDAKYAKELLPNNPAALWVSLQAHLVKAGVHEHHDERDQRRAELELAGKDADDLKPYTALPEAVVNRWLYFREVDKEEEVLGELRQASEKTDHVNVTFCCALTLYRRGQRGDFEEALRVVENRFGSYNDRLRPFVLAEYDYPDKHDWPARARKAYDDFAARAKDGVAVMATQSVLCLLGKKGDAVEASKALLQKPDLFYTLRREPILRCLRYNAGDLPEDDLVQRAKGSRWNQCLAHYYVAMTKLAEGDRKGAKEHFDKVVKTRAYGWGEYEMSWVFRARLANDPTWPPWIPKGPAK
jgi:tRNA A-37 threonylcarbamoyl transferase component Bud32